MSALFGDVSELLDPLTESFARDGRPAGEHRRGAQGSGLHEVDLVAVERGVGRGGNGFFDPGHQAMSELQVLQRLVDEVRFGDEATGAVHLQDDDLARSVAVGDLADLLHFVVSGPITDATLDREEEDAGEVIESLAGSGRVAVVVGGVGPGLASHFGRRGGL
jgi:hypothetical protein